MLAAKCNRLYVMFIACLLPLFSTCIAQDKLITWNEQQAETTLTYSQLGVMACIDSNACLTGKKPDFTKLTFKTNTQKELNMGITKFDYWIHFKIYNNSRSVSDAVVILENSRLNEVHGFVVEKDSIISNFITGDFFPFKQRPLLHHEFAFPLNLQPYNTGDVYLQIKHIGSSLQLPIKMQQKNEFIQDIGRANMVMGIQLGVMFIVLAFGIFFFASNPSANFITYVLYLNRYIMDTFY